MQQNFMLEAQAVSNMQHLAEEHIQLQRQRHQSKVDALMARAQVVEVRRGQSYITSYTTSPKGAHDMHESYELAASARKARLRREAAAYEADVAKQAQFAHNAVVTKMAVACPVKPAPPLQPQLPLHMRR